MSECALRENVDLNLEEVSRIALALKSLAAYSMAYEDENPAELQAVVDEGLEAVHHLFDC